MRFTSLTLFLELGWSSKLIVSKKCLPKRIWIWENYGWGFLRFRLSIWNFHTWTSNCCLVTSLTLGIDQIVILFWRAIIWCLVPCYYGAIKVSKIRIHWLHWTTLPSLIYLAVQVIFAVFLLSWCLLQQFCLRLPTPDETILQRWNRNGRRK